ncbi:hypothetical protein L6164_011409 [Bauhinia variegata]|nr:hypothetical protein L6164_011409 [Bauhinia variegata]
MGTDTSIEEKVEVEGEKKDERNKSAHESEEVKEKEGTIGNNTEHHKVNEIKKAEGEVTDNGDTGDQNPK